MPLSVSPEHPVAAWVVNSWEPAGTRCRCLLETIEADRRYRGRNRIFYYDENIERKGERKREREKRGKKKGRDTLMYTRDVWARLDKAAECSVARFFSIPILVVSSLFCMPLGRWHARHSGQVIRVDRYNDRSHGCLVINSANWLHENGKSFRLAPLLMIWTLRNGFCGYVLGFSRGSLHFYILLASISARVNSIYYLKKNLHRNLNKWFKVEHPFLTFDIMWIFFVLTFI